jgi:hypothetical protein
MQQGAKRGGRRVESLDEIGDSELFTGREMKRLLADLLRDDSHDRDRWIELDEALAILNTGRARPITSGALRKRCRRWELSREPAVRVRRKGAGEGSHWLLSEADLCSMVRQGVKVTPARPAPPPAPGADELDATLAHWNMLVTRNL